MSDLICPVCGKPNPPTAESCQYCGANLNPSGTEKNNSEPDDNLPDWLKEMNRPFISEGAGAEPGAAAPVAQAPQPPVPQSPAPQPPAAPVAPKKTDKGPLPDYLAGLSNLGSEEEDDAPDWLSNLQGVLPAHLQIEPAQTPAPQSAQPAPASPASTPEEPAPESGDNPSFGQMSAFKFEGAPPAAQSDDSNANWLAAFDTQDNSGSSALPDGQSIPDAIDPGIFADLPDWLSNMASSSGQTFPTGAIPASPDQSAKPVKKGTDWLSSLGGDFTADESAGQAESASMASGEPPDWLERMSADSSAPAASAPAEYTPDEGQPDWLSSLPGAASGQVGAPDAQEPPSLFPADGNLSDWSGDFGGAAALAPEGAGDNSLAPGKSASEELPDWLSSLQASAPAAYEPASSTPPAAASAFDELPDWMSSLQNTDAAQAGTPETPLAPANPPSTDLPDWLTSMQASALAAESTSAEQKSAETVAAPQEDDTSDWLSSLQGFAPAPVETSGSLAAPAAPVKLPFDDEPDWLSSLQGFSSTPASADFAPAQSQPEIPAQIPASDDVPDWLSNFQGSSDLASFDAVPTLSQTNEPAGAPGDELPGWSQAATGQPAEAPTPDETVHQQRPFNTDSLAEFMPPAGADELPDWLSSIRGEAAADKKPAQAAAQPPAQPPVAQPAQAPGGAAPADQTPAVTSQAAPLDGIPVIPGSAVEQNIDSIFSMETPDWLSNFLPATPQQPTAAPFEKAAAGPELPTAELPSWVQALRPMESVVEETAESAETNEPQDVENEGPLAGLFSVLPTQPGMLDLRTQKVYAHELLTNETQLAQAALLENLIKTEHISQVQPLHAKASRIQPLRWIIGTALLVVILLFAALGSKVFPSPAASAESSPVGMLLKTVSGLPDNAPVLVVMDYQPGYAGEMESALGPVLEHLMSKKTRLAFVSTSPVGGLMADRLLSKFAGSYPYQAGLQYVKLGYLPGGAAGIKVFADQPAATLGQESLSGNLWNTPVLQDVSVNSEIKLSNFAAIVIATDNPDIGRLWIEQAQPVLGTKPMLMVVSAQAEPMIQPYLLSRQISGLVAGMEGGLQYEDARGKPGQARIYWDSYSAALMVAELIILIGGAWSLRKGFQARRVEVEQDEV